MNLARCSGNCESTRGLTIEQVAERLLCSPSKVSRLETGIRVGTLRDIRDLCDRYGVTGMEQRDYLMELARESKRQGWWQSYDVPFRTYIGLESDATSISVFTNVVIPGILQTVEYAQAIITRHGIAPKAIEQHVAVRLRRQARLEQDSPPQLAVVVDEAALRRRVGSPSIMKAQLDRILEKSSLPNVSVRAIPFESGAYDAMEIASIFLDSAIRREGLSTLTA